MINKNGFSIIIPSLNQSNFLNDCLKSIHNQKYDNYEIIIVDSKSTDDTANIVKFYKEKYNKIKSFISEQDDGQFDAINKGIKIAEKDWVTWQNCDDLYYDDQVLNNFNKFINLNPSKKLFVGNIILTNEKLEKVRDLKFVKPSFYSLLYEEMTLTNQSAFWQKSLHQDLGFLKNMRINFDYEWFLRILKNYPDCGTHINKTFGIYRIHQLQKTKILNLEDVEFKKKIKKDYGFQKNIDAFMKIILKLRRFLLFILNGNFFYVYRGLKNFFLNVKKYP